MKFRVAVVVVALGFWCQSSWAGASMLDRRSSSPSKLAVAASLQQVLKLTNVERAKAGLKPLKFDDTLAKAAYWKAIDLSTCSFFDHKDSQGRAPKDRIESFGYRNWERLSENIAGGYFSPEEVVAAWMDSPGHRKNILDPKVNEIGIAFHFDSKSKHGYYWVQNFARRSGS